MTISDDRRGGTTPCPALPPDTVAAASPPSGQMKRCTRCGEMKPLTDFPREPKGRGGYGSRCRLCLAARMREYRQANLERERERDRRYRAANRKRINERNRGRRSAPEPRERHNERAARYREANGDRVRETHRRWYRNNLDTARAKNAATRKRLKAAVFDHYGRQCACCGATEHLQIDHVNGDGREHRKEVGRTWTEMYRWIIGHGFPPQFQTLCRPCNVSKGRGERCRLLHQESLTETADS